MGIAFQIILLAALMYAFARHEADISWPKLFLVFVPLIIAANMLAIVIGIGALFVYVGCMIVALKAWFYLEWPKAITISIAHIVVSTALAILGNADEEVSLGYPV